ncbi:MAG: hypothetical protein LQ350_007713 [Teloschistes chrysophthalmus]|nr:MAG: hypothetical protein LQ350_007713 [Niorma chrysophthalma]
MDAQVLVYIMWAPSQETIIMLNTFAALCTLLPLAFSSPIVPRDDPFVPPVKFGAIAARSASPIHLQSINANGGAFWIGKNTTTYCPLANQTDCPPGKDTVFAVGNGGLGGAGLNTVVPGGQQVYVAPTGALSFTTAHSAYIPPGSALETFNATLGTEGGPLGQFTFSGLGANGFIACPVSKGKGPYQVFANVKNMKDQDVPSKCKQDCLPFGALTAPSDSFTWHHERSDPWRASVILRRPEATWDHRPQPYDETLQSSGVAPPDDRLQLGGENANGLNATPSAVNQLGETRYDHKSFKKTLSAQGLKSAVLWLTEQEYLFVATANDLARMDTKATDAFVEALQFQMAQHKPLSMDEDDWLEQKMEEKLAEIPKETREWIEGMMDNPKVEDSEIRKLLDGTPGELYYEQCILEEINSATSFLAAQDDDDEDEDGDRDDEDSSISDGSERDFLDSLRGADFSYKSGMGFLPDWGMYEYNY